MDKYQSIVKESYCENKILLNLFLNYIKTDSLSLLKDVNTNMIKNIRWGCLYDQTPYQSYNNDTCTYTKMYTKNMEEKLIFTIDIIDSDTPIIIACKNSRKLDKCDMTTYQYIGSYKPMDTFIDKIPNIDNFLTKYFSKNNFGLTLQTLGFVLGYLVNNNLDLFQKN